MNLTNIYYRQNMIGDISFYTNLSFHDLMKLPYSIISTLSNIAIHVDCLTNEEWMESVGPSASKDVYTYFIHFPKMVRKILQTQMIKYELLSRIVEGYNPPSIRERMTELLNMDVSHISIPGLRFIEHNLHRYDEFRQPIDTYFDTADSGEFELSVFEEIFCTVDQTSVIKEELMAKVFHPDRMEVWTFL